MIIKCKMCGGELAWEEGATVCECEYCGTKQTIPQMDSEKKTNLFNRANRLRMSAEFDRAAAVYASVTAEFPEEAEAYWGLCLCKYGIEYVDDPASGKKIPTCHRTRSESILDDPDFEQACENADAVARKVYREEAKAIDRLQRSILSIVANEAPYDVFICYKETGEDGGRTEDSVLAQEIYDALTAKGLKVFFSRVTLEDKLGQEYEPYIYAALHSARVMLAVGTAFEHFDAVWVKNEWARFLDMMKEDGGKTLIPCYRGIDAYDMPREFKNLQGQDMGKLGWLQDLTRGVLKLCGKDGQGAQTVVQQVVQSGNPTVDSLLQRAQLFLEDADWESADGYADKVLDIEPSNGEAYLVKLMAEIGARKQEDLTEAESSFADNPNYLKLLRFGSEAQKENAKALAKGQALNALRRKLEVAESVADCQAIRTNMEKLGSISGMAVALSECDARIEEINQQAYGAAVVLKQKGCLEEAIAAFDALGDYQDSKEQIRVCRQKMEAQERADALQREANRQKAEAAAAKRRKNTVIGVIAAVIAVATALLMVMVVIPKGHYDKGVVARTAQNWEESIHEFEQARSYSDATTQIFATRYAEGEAKRAVEDWDGAVTAFEQAGSYSDAATQILATRYAEGEAKRKVQDWEGAVTAFEQAGSYGDAATQILATRYAEGVARRETEDWNGATTAFERAMNYSDAETQILETDYLHAKALMETGDFSEAVSVFKRIGGYKDVNVLLTSNDGLLVAIKEETLDAVFSVWNTVTFGRYEQDGDALNGEEPVKWVVLARDNEKALLLSSIVLEARPYHGAESDITWEECSLRGWLNGEFLSKVFSSSEQRAILPTLVDNSKSQGHNRDGGNNTEDRIFLLSYAEVQSFFELDQDRTCECSESAVRLGANRNKENGNLSWWWLRSPGFSKDKATLVHADGALKSGAVNNEHGGIRPAVWIDIHELALADVVCEYTERLLVYSDTITCNSFNEIGSIVTLGHYEQDNDTSNGDEPIEWIVLDTDGKRSLLLSRYALDTRDYSTRWVETSWENCDLRAWLNEGFLQSAFTINEQNLIYLTTVKNSRSQGYYGTDGGNDTKDYLFLLSYMEARRYFPWTAERIGMNTPYALAQKSEIGRSDTCLWLLRSPGTTKRSVMYVSYDGSFSSGYVAYKDNAIRPALWVNLEAL